MCIRDRIRALCEKYDFALSKGFGQNFIINPGLPPKIVDASGVDKRYGVIEICLLYTSFPDKQKDFVFNISETDTVLVKEIRKGIDRTDKMCIRDRWWTWWGTPTPGVSCSRRAVWTRPAPALCC